MTDNINKAKVISIFFDMAKKYNTYEDMINEVRNLNSSFVISDNEYNYMQKEWDKLLYMFDNYDTIKWSYKNPDQHSELDRITEELVIIKNFDETYSWYETENYHFECGFKSQKDAFNSALEYLKNYEEFKLLDTLMNNLSNLTRYKV